MSYHVYTTKGIVLAEKAVGEADRVYTILTRDLGKIHARAVGVRKDTSKLRGNVEPFCLTTVSLIKGKNFWRLTSAGSTQRISAKSTLARPFSLIEKLVQGEEPHPELFDAIEQQILAYLEQGSKDPKSDEVFEINLVSQILFHLGYLKKSDLSLDKKSLIEAINNGIQSSHL